MAQDNFLKVALGSDRYVIDAPFGDLPADLGKVTDIAAGRDGTVFLLTRHDCRSEEARDCVHMLTAEGAYLGSWGRDHIVDAHKLTIDGAGRIWVVDRDAHQIIAFDRAGRVLTSLGRRHCPNEPFNHPTDIAFFPDGGIAVTDGYAGARVHLFSADGQPEGGFGALGRAPGQFLVPHGLGILSGDRIVVADRENGRVQVFSRGGTVQGVFSFFVRPQDVLVGDDDTILVTDSIPTLTRISCSGEVLGRCRATQNGPHGFCLGPAGDIYMAENNPSRVTRMAPLAVSQQPAAMVG